MKICTPAIPPSRPMSSLTVRSASTRTVRHILLLRHRPEKKHAAQGDHGGAGPGQANRPRAPPRRRQFQQSAMLDEAIWPRPEPLVTLQAECHPYLRDQGHRSLLLARPRADRLSPARSRPPARRCCAGRYRAAHRQDLCGASGQLRWLMQQGVIVRHSALVRMLCAHRAEYRGVRFCAQ